ncbi:MAG: hypothetical protein N3G76_00800 [Candidatus Micrarchaeota archaeon]|nr:hypothetical protein [Candidatus Micrarchaeota archaeon]
MEYEVLDGGLAEELEMRGIGYRKGEKLFVDVLQAAYLTEIGKARYDDALDYIRKDEKLALAYVVFKDLRKKMHVANYVEKDGIMLAYEKGMIPKHAESKFAVKAIKDMGITLEDMARLREDVRRARKDLIYAVVDKEGKVWYYKFQEVEM